MTHWFVGFPKDEKGKTQRTYLYFEKDREDKKALVWLEKIIRGLKKKPMPRQEEKIVERINELG